MHRALQLVRVASLLSTMQAGSRDALGQQVMEPERTVRGQTIESNHQPAARLRFARDFTYVGGQRFVLYGVAEAEQHFFVDADSSGTIRSLYWVQFEHYLPSSSGSYTYASRQVVTIGPFDFIADTKVFADYSKTVLNPDSREDSDQAYAGRLLRRKGYKPPAAAARTRMFYVPDSTRRAELMVIFVEALTPSDTVGRELPIEGPAQDRWPELADRVVRDAKRGLSIER